MSAEPNTASDEAIQNKLEQAILSKLMTSIKGSIEEFKLDKPQSKNFNLTQVSQMLPTAFLALQDLVASQQQVMNKLVEKNEELNSMLEQKNSMLEQKDLLNSSLKSDMSKLKDQLIELQNDKVKSQIRISGLNLHQKAKHGSENSVQSYEVTKQLMDAMNLKITNFDCWRVAPKEKAGKNDLVLKQ